MDWWSHKYLSFEPWRLQFSYLSPPPLQISSLINAFISKPQGFCSGTVSAPRPRSNTTFPSVSVPASEESSLSELEPADPDFYKIGYVRRVRA
ncbi:unnamed protein product [Brassica rapa subsp. trilocularis]